MGLIQSALIAPWLLTGANATEKTDTMAVRVLRNATTAHHSEMSLVRQEVGCSRHKQDIDLVGGLVQRSSVQFKNIANLKAARMHETDHFREKRRTLVDLQ